MTLSPTVPELICEAMARLRIDRAQFADDARVSVRTVSRWRSGALTPHPNCHDRLLAAVAPAGADLVADLRRALRLPPDPRAVPPPPPPARDLDALRKELELALHAAAERMDCSPRAARAAFVRLLGALETLGVSLAEARAWLDAGKDAWRADDVEATRD